MEEFIETVEKILVKKVKALAFIGGQSI